MGAGRNISFLLQLIFVVLKYTEEEMNDLETVLFMLTSYIYNRLWNLVFLRTRRRSSLCGFDWEENAEKRAKSMD